MSRWTIIVNGDVERRRASAWAMKAKPGMRIEFKEAKRTTDQNSRMWAMLTDVATQLDWHGVKLTPDQWKLVFLDALKREVQIVPNLDGNGFVNIGTSSSDLSVAEMGDLMTLIEQFGANHNVRFHDTEERAA